MSTVQTHDFKQNNVILKQQSMSAKCLSLQMIYLIKLRKQILTNQLLVKWPQIGQRDIWLKPSLDHSKSAFVQLHLVISFNVISKCMACVERQWCDFFLSELGLEKCISIVMNDGPNNVSRKMLIDNPDNYKDNAK